MGLASWGRQGVLIKNKNGISNAVFPGVEFRKENQTVAIARHRVEE